MENEWSYPCSDEELSRGGSPTSGGGGEWRPAAATLEALYAAAQAGPPVALRWRCPGRAALAQPAPAAPPPPPRAASPPGSNFDFLDEVTSLHLRVRREGEDTLRGSAKKKTSSFDGILSNMMRHKRIEQMERDADNSTNS